MTNRGCDFALAVGDRTVGQRARKRDGAAQLRDGRRLGSMRDRLNKWIFGDAADAHDTRSPRTPLGMVWRPRRAGKRRGRARL